jgi:UDP-N-acetylglucosamine 2-epimerase
MVGNSSAGLREGSFLGVPVVNVGDRQRGRLTGPNVRHAPLEATAIVQETTAWCVTTRPTPSMIYGSGQSGRVVASALRDWLTHRHLSGTRGPSARGVMALAAS